MGAVKQQNPIKSWKSLPTNKENPLDSNSSLTSSFTPSSPTTTRLPKQQQKIPNVDQMKKLDAKTSFPNFGGMESMNSQQQPMPKNQLRTGWNSVVSFISRIGLGIP